MKSRLLEDFVVPESAVVLELLARKDEALLVRRDALLVLNFRFHVVDRVRRLDFESDGFPRQSFTAINKERYGKVDDDTTRQKTLT